MSAIDKSTIVLGKAHGIRTGVFSVLICFSLSTQAQGVVEVDEKDIQYAPSTITIQTGQTLLIVNKDPFFHKSRISRLSDDGLEGEVVMPAKKEDANTQQAFVFRHSGKYKLRCMVHDGMTAIIEVKN